MRRPVTEMNRDRKNRTVRCRVTLCLWLWSGACAALVMTGCGAEPARFSLNLVHLHSQDAPDEKGQVTLSPAARQNIATVLDALYGTPDAPRLPPLPEPEVLNFLEISKLQRAAGPTGRDDPQGGERGLYRKHCIHCHGANGDGAGPTAQYLNPYPRDYRMGLFKFKSTEGTDTPPTHEDLKRVLVEGVPGTAMPSFKVLDDGEIEALVHYVKYLALRGQTERLLVEELAPEADGRYLDPQNVVEERKIELLETVATLAGTWQAAVASEVPPPPANWEDAASIARGRELFMGKKALCSSCHGDSALGDGNRDIFDDWTKDFMGPTGVNVSSYAPLRLSTWNEDPRKVLLEEFYARGALKVRPLKPRNLRRGVYRGGRRPVDLFRRVRNGILNYMPYAEKADSADAIKGLIDDDVWHVVAYVRSLPYEKITEPSEEIRFQRDLP